jgi:hypothetical protein
MKAFDFDPPRPRRRTASQIWNALTLTVLLAAALLAGVFALIFVNPGSGLNPFPPPVLPTAMVMPSATPTPRGVLPPTWTPSPTLEPSVTPTPRPTSTLYPTNTPFSLVTSEPVTPSATVKGPKGMPFVLQKDTPLAITNIYHPDKACSWIGVGGQVFDLKGSAVLGMQVQLGGSLNGTAIPNGYPTLTGILPYAPGYYEFVLGEKPFASRSKLWVQLVDQSGAPVSDKAYFDTFEDCEKNLIIINFKQAR